MKYFFLLLPIILLSCRSTKELNNFTKLKLPSKFQNSELPQTDSTIAFRKLISDSNLLLLIDSGLQNNQSAKALFERINISNAELRMARGNFLPQVNLQTQTGVQRFGEYTVDGIGNFDTNLSDNITPDRRIPQRMPDLYTGLQAQWEADVWGKLRNRKKAAVNRYLSSYQAWQDARLILMYHIAERYFQLQTLDYKLKIAKENELLQERALELVKIQKQAGLVTELAVKQFEAQLYNTRAVELDLQKSIIELETSLNILLGRMPAAIVRTSLITESSFKQLTSLLTPTAILSTRPDVLKAELELQAAGADVAAARAAFYPSISLHGNYGLHTLRSQVWFQFPVSLAYWLGGGITLPVFQRNQLKAELAASKSRKNIAYLEYESVVTQAINEAQMYIDMQTIIEQAANEKQLEVNSLNAGLAASQDLFLAGRATYLEVITAQKSVLLAQFDLADIELMKVKNNLGLCKAFGIK